MMRRGAGRVLACAMPVPDPIPALKRQAGTELARLVAGWNGDDIGTYLGTDRSRIADLRRGRLDRFSLETLLRLLDRAGVEVELRFTRRSTRSNRG